jgi:4-hydroxy-4-methyl-2-oxoglutarate aldolase
MEAPKGDAGVEQLARLSTSAVSDALDRHGIAGQVFGLRPLDRSFRVAGRAFTVRYQPVDVGGGTVGDYIDDVPPGEVVVLDNAGRTDATVWGDILTVVAHRRGLGGTVIDGACRDSSRSLELGYPLFSRASFMRTGKDRVQVAEVQGPVVLGGVRVRPGDALLGDADGVVVVPREAEEEVLAAAVEIDKAEEAIRRLVLSGSRLDEARRQHGYHALQHRT